MSNPAKKRSRPCSSAVDIAPFLLSALTGCSSEARNDNDADSSSNGGTSQLSDTGIGRRPASAGSNDSGGGASAHTAGAGGDTGGSIGLGGNDPGTGGFIGNPNDSNDPRPFHVKVAENQEYYRDTDHSRWQSDPSATKVIFLDFHSPKMQDPGFQLQEFVGIAEDYWPFRVNVTLDKVIYEATVLENKVKLLYDENAPFETAGQCPSRSFGTQEGQSQCAVKSDYGGSTAAHEIGHALGLEHDWTDEMPGYHRGSPNFAPIMGSGTPANGAGNDMKYRTFWNRSSWSVILLGVQHDFQVI